MRPPDENQNGSTRPNFMSASRRTGGADDNILAKLERDAKRTTSGKSWKNQTRLAWCGLASLAIVGLIATLASLAKENMAVHRQPLVIEAKASPPEPVASFTGALPMGKGGFAPLPAGTVKLAAAVIEVPPEHAVAISSTPVHVPPMVMLKPESAPAAKPAAAPPAVRSTPPKANAKTTPAKPAPSATPGTTRAVAAGSPARTVAATAPARSAVAGPPPRAVAAAAPARAKKTAPAAPSARPEPAAVDNDIALLSAIIMHASRHAEERAKMEAAQCGAGKKCAPQSDLLTPPKATD